MIKITSNLYIDPSELKYTYIRSPGPGGQNVNKVASGVQLRFNITHSATLPEVVQLRLVSLLSSKLTRRGEMIIKATRYRTQESNKQDAINRLIAIIKQGAIIPKKRKKTKPTKTSQQKRLTQKKLHAKTKSLRKINIPFNE